MAKSTAPPFRGLPRAARAYVLAVLFAVPPALFGATHIAHQPELEVALLVATVVLCAGGNLFEVFAPGHYSFQPNLVFFFWAAVLLPPWAVPLVAVASYLPGWVAHRFRWYMVAFNIADYALAGLLVNTVVRAAHAAVDTDVGAAAVLFASALAFVAINHLLIVAVISFSRHAPLSRCLKETAGGLPLDAALALTGACLVVLWIRAPVFAVLAAGPMMLIYRALWVPLLRHKSRTDPK